MRPFEFFRNRRRSRPAASRAVVPSGERLERRALMSASADRLAPRLSPTGTAELPPGVLGYDPSFPMNPTMPPKSDQLLTAPPPGTPPADQLNYDVPLLLARAAASVQLNNAIIAIVDRNGTILGVRVESGVSPLITKNPTNLVFAIDGAVSLARTGAFFGNDTAPLTSRTIQDISQTTMTQREVDSNPDVPDPGGNSTAYGPGFVAPVGIKGHFPPGIMYTPQVDLFQIEGTNRDTYSNATGTRFNVPVKYMPESQYVPPKPFPVQPASPFKGNLVAPASYGQVTGILPTAQSRGIGTLPGGLPIYKNNFLVGGIGVFFPGTTGYATEENSKLNTPLVRDPHKIDLSDAAEFMALVAVGGSSKAGFPIGAVNGAPALPLGFVGEPVGRIDLAGITLDTFGPHGLEGLKNLLNFGATLGAGNPNDGVNYPVDAKNDTFLPGQPLLNGWLVTPHTFPGDNLTVADVEAIVAQGIAEANQVRAQIRLPLNNTARMVFAVSDENGNILGLYRMPDATYFSVQVAVAKARNVAYYDNPALLQPIDQVKGVPAGTAFTARTFRYLALPFFPEGIDIYPPGPFSILTDGGVTHYGTNKGAPLPAKDFQSAQGFAAFNPTANFHDPYNKANQSGVVFFPGSAPLYKDTNGAGLRNQLVGGLGVSGDGVFQDDDVTAVASLAYAPPRTVKRADMVKVKGVRLPFFKFNRNPHVPLNGSFLPLVKISFPAPRLIPRHKS
jgi:uncharacterized protein GlcG (DUF336 family)